MCVPLQSEKKNLENQTLQGVHVKSVLEFLLAIFNCTCDSFSTAHVGAQSHGTQRNGWVTSLRMWTDAENAFCVEAYISSNSYKETQRLFSKSLI